MGSVDGSDPGVGGKDGGHLRYNGVSVLQWDVVSTDRYAGRELLSGAIKEELSFESKGGTRESKEYDDLRCRSGLVVKVPTKKSPVTQGSGGRENWT